LINLSLEDFSVNFHIWHIAKLDRAKHLNALLAKLRMERGADPLPSLLIELFGQD
jgi:hypothetical protein